MEEHLIHPILARAASPPHYCRASPVGVHADLAAFEQLDNCKNKVH